MTTTTLLVVGAILGGGAVFVFMSIWAGTVISRMARRHQWLLNEIDEKNNQIVAITKGGPSVN